MILEINQLAASETASVVAGSTLLDGSSVFRPIQYLGSKLRSIDYLTDWTSNRFPNGGTVLDLFTGTSVVAQSFADSGMQVVATDAMAFCSVFAESLLCIGRTSSNASPSSLLDIVTSISDSAIISPEFEKLAHMEQRALEASDAHKFFEMSKSIPQAWRDNCSPSKSPIKWPRRPEYVTLIDNKQEAIISSHYAGTYFGVEQALTIDKYRAAIEVAFMSKALSRWEYVTALTALLSSCSSAVFSPGKHFAQYHRIDESKDLKFHQKRILSDRSISIEKAFMAALDEIWKRPNQAENEHIALNTSMEDLIEKQDLLPAIDVIYADPPYTAQQYSRFYHIPESIVKFRPQEMQEFRGGITAGLYPTNRFKSRFSSKRQAPDAFANLINFSNVLEADLLISYSGSVSGATGNDRMIGLDELLTICRKSYSKVSVDTLPHAYRQFNESSIAVNARADEEYCVMCRN